MAITSSARGRLLGIVGTTIVAIVGILFFDWSLFSILIAFWIETGIIALFSVIKLVTLFTKSKQNIYVFAAVAQAIGTIGFMFGTFIFVMALFSGLPGNDGWSGMNLFVNSFGQSLSLVVTLLASYTYSFVTDFLHGEENALLSADISTPELQKQFGSKLFGDYFKRIFLLILMVIVGAALIAFTSSTTTTAIVFIMAKFVTDVFGLRSTKAAAPA